MLTMESSVGESIVHTNDVASEDGEILEDGEIDDVVEEVVDNEEEEKIEAEEGEGSNEDDEKRKHHRKSHKHRKRRHEDRKSDEKKSRHRKKKAEDISDDGGESPPSKKKKKRKKHSKDKKERESTSPELETMEKVANVTGRSESPPLPSEELYYGYDMYDSGNKYNRASLKTFDQAEDFSDKSANYNSKRAMDAYGYHESYQQMDDEVSSGSDSYYSDFESHLAQYQSYKKHSLQDKSGKNEEDDLSDEDNYYSIGYNDTSRKQKRGREVGHRSQRNRSTKNEDYDDKRRSGDARPRRTIRGSPDVPVCRYYREGHCSKGDSCGFSHQIPPRKGPRRKIPELCQFFVTGTCANESKCNFMHEEYPCKYFHSGTKCLAGEKCMFSHDTLDETGKAIVQRWQDIYNSVEDAAEIKALEKAGLRPLQKPPPGMGLLPTPPAKLALVPPDKLPAATDENPSAIPSLLDIKVQPTPEFQLRIDAGAIPSLTMSDEQLIAHRAAMAMRNPGFPHSQGLLPLPTPPMVPPPVVSFYGPSLLGPGPTPIGMPPPMGLPPPMHVPPPVLPTLPPSSKSNGDSKGFYDKLYSKDKSSPVRAAIKSENDTDGFPQETSDASKLDKENHDDDFDEEGEDNRTENKEDVIRMDDHDVTKEVKVPDFLPAKQKALFMRIHQNRKSPNERHSHDESSHGNAGNATDSWTYSSDEEDSSASRRSNSSNDMRRKSAAPSSSVQSIMQMISNKKGTSDVDTNLLTKVASVISMDSSQTATSLSSHHRSMMSPPQKPPVHQRERRSSGSSNSSPGHPRTHHHPQPHPVRRRLSTSELNKEPVAIPLVTKQTADSVHSSHPDPRISLSRLFGQKRIEFRGAVPPYGKDLIMSSGQLVGLKITLSSESGRGDVPGQEKRSDPRLSAQHARSKAATDPRVKSNDPRLRMRAASMSKTSTSPHSATTVSEPKSIIPPKPIALLTKPTSSIIPSLPELNLDLANISDSMKSKSPPRSKLSDPLSRLPKLLRASALPGANSSSGGNLKAAASADTSEVKTTTSVPTIAPYDPRYITAAASPARTSTTTSGNSPPPPSYDPRAMINPISSAVPSLYDPRSSGNETKTKTIPLPKLTPAPGYMKKKVAATNGSDAKLPSGEQQDF